MNLQWNGLPPSYWNGILVLDVGRVKLRAVVFALRRESDHRQYDWMRMPRASLTRMRVCHFSRSLAYHRQRNQLAPAKKPARQSRNVRPHDLTVLVKLDRVTAPKQTRTEKRLQEIVQALESLLDGRPFAEITIPDIAERAGCGTASIYARFQDKRSILVALHESLRDRQMAEIDQVTSLKLHERLSFEQTTLSICRNIVSYYAENQNLLRASYLLDDEEIYERHASVVRYASEKIAVLLLPKLDTRIDSETVLNKRFELATNAIFALMQQYMIFATRDFARNSPARNRELVTELAMLVRMILTAEA